MKRTLLLITFFFVICPAAAVDAADPSDNWRELVAEAYAESDLVMSGIVQSVDDQTAIDGGHVYNLLVTEQHKGAPPQQISIRAGGFFYLVRLEIDETVLVFLKPNQSNQALDRSPAYSLVEVPTLTPMIFRVKGGETEPVDSRLQAVFARPTVDEMANLLSSFEQ